MNQGTLTMESLRQGLFARAIGVLTTFFFVFVFYLNPTSLAVADELSKTAKHQAALEAVLENTPEKKLSHRLHKLRDKVVKEMPQAAADRKRTGGVLSRMKQKMMGDEPLTSADQKALADLSTAIDEAYAEALAGFEQEQQAVVQNTAIPSPLKTLMTQRYQAAFKRITEHHDVVKTQLNAVLAASTTEDKQRTLAALNATLQQERFNATHTPATPEHLPWGAPTGKVREPVNTPKELHAATGITPRSPYVQLALAEGEGSNLVLAQALAQATNHTTELSESIDVQITPDIKTLAASLHNSTTEIYAWVHNNIRYIPSYGSIQGAQYTLETKQGNAIDTASLLIALLRAAKIPARYAYGTVEIPAAQVMNWVGGASTPEAAYQLLSQGGIPTVGLVEGGVIKAFRLEHVWVEAWVDYFPSRGLIEKQGDSWIPMDASFKQYDFSQGMDIKTAVPFDAQSLVNNIQQKATINKTEGWVQNVPQADIETQLTDFQNKLKTYIEQQNPNATVGEVLGLQKITIIPARPLAAGLPYQRIVTSQTFAEVSDKLRHKFQYNLSTQLDGSPSTSLISFVQPTVTLAGKTLALSFKPSTADDEAIIASYLPKPDANGQIDPNQLPKNLPGYLINLTAELTANGTTLAQAPAGAMGDELYEELGLWSPRDQWETSINHPTAGEYRAIGLDLQGANPEQAARLKAHLEQTKGKLESQNQTQLASLTKHELVGDLLYGTIFNYFALNDLQDKIAAQSSNIITYRLPSYGIFSTSLKTQYWFGIPKSVEFGGLSMDVDHIKVQRIAKTNNNEEAIAFTQSIGSRMSAMEHLVPEQMFSTETNKAQGISAVKALAIASQQGQKIWTIDKTNLDLALSKITLDIDAEQDIRNAVNAGKVVTAHEAQINFNGWIGEGYVVLDKETGAGAYIIAGGGNGSETTASESSPSNLGGATGLVMTMAAPLIIEHLPDATASVNFFGKVKCNLSEVAVTIAVVVAFAAAVYASSSIIKMLEIPELAFLAAGALRSMVVDALMLAGMVNAEEVYQRNCDCASGIRGVWVNGVQQCWICSVASEKTIRNNTKIAKTNTRGRSCKGGVTSEQAAINIPFFQEEIRARTEENACWDPADPDHETAVQNAENAIKTCEGYL